MTIIKNLNEKDTSGQSGIAEIKELLKRNLELAEENHAIMKKMEKFIFWSRIGSYLKFILIFLPLILSYFLLSPLLKDAFGQYKALLGDGQGSNLDTLPSDFFKIIPKK